MQTVGSYRVELQPQKKFTSGLVRQDWAGEQIEGMQSLIRHMQPLAASRAALREQAEFHKASPLALCV
jgi:hypothetical protein